MREFTCNFTPKITITYSSYETPDNNSQNSSANDDRNMNMIPNENTLQGLSNGSNPNLLSAAVMEKISWNTTKPPVQCHIENYKNPENSSKLCHRFHFFPSPFQPMEALIWATVSFFAYISFSFAALHFLRQEVQKMSDFCTFCNILSRKMQNLKEFCKSCNTCNLGYEVTHFWWRNQQLPVLGQK